MLVDDILAKIANDVHSSKDYFSFETFVLNLLKFHIESQQKSLQTDLGPRSFVDAFAPEGFDEITGPTAFEIKMNIARYPVQFIIDRIITRVARSIPEPNLKNLVIISASKYPASLKNKLEKQLGNTDFNFNILIWGPDELNKIVAKHKKKANDIANNLFSLRLESAVLKPSKDWKERRSEIIERISELYKKGQFALFLGAGVSSSAGMPDWNTLLNSLFVTYLTKEFDDDTAIRDTDIDEIVNRLNRVDEPSALMAARYLRKGLARNHEEIKEFTGAITKNLYKLRDTSRRIDSDLIKSVAALCMPKRTGAKVKAVTTYNFDDLVERQLTKTGIQHHSIYTDTDSYDPDELPIYHVHGFLPENRDEYAGLENSTLVFSEEGYHQIYSEAYHWSNLVQLNSLRENNCLMVGLSMTDPNLRRLLDISACNLESTRHFTFMKRMTEDFFCYEKDKKQVIKNTDGAVKFLDRHHSLNEELMKELGVTIIWYESYEDIPMLIDKIREV